MSQSSLSEMDATGVCSKPRLCQMIYHFQSEQHTKTHKNLQQQALLVGCHVCSKPRLCQATSRFQINTHKHTNLTQALLVGWHVCSKPKLCQVTSRLQILTQTPKNNSKPSWLDATFAASQDCHLISHFQISHKQTNLNTSFVGWMP